MIDLNAVKDIDGKAIIAVQQATMVHAVSQQEVTLNTVKAVLLADDSVVFVCDHINAPECTMSAESPRSVFAHQRAHSPQRMFEKAQAELEARKLAASNRAKKAAATRSANRKNGNGKAEAPVSEPIIDNATDESLAASLDQLEDVTEALEKAIADIDAAVLQLRIDIKRMKLQAKEKPVDPVLLEKAAKYDALKGILG